MFSNRFMGIQDIGQHQVFIIIFLDELLVDFSELFKITKGQFKKIPCSIFNGLEFNK